MWAWQLLCTPQQCPRTRQRRPKIQNRIPRWIENKIASIAQWIDNMKARIENRIAKIEKKIARWIEIGEQEDRK